MVVNAEVGNAVRASLMVGLETKLGNSCGNTHLLIFKSLDEANYIQMFYIVYLRWFFHICSSSIYYDL